MNSPDPHAAQHSPPVPKATRTRVCIVLDYGRSEAAWTRWYEDGLVAEDSPYSYSLARRYADVSYACDHREGRIAKLIRLSLKFILDFDPVHVFRNRKIIYSSDIIWTHTEREHLAVSLLKAIRKRPFPKIIGQSVWLYDTIDDASWPRRKLVHYLLGQLDIETVHTLTNVNSARTFRPNRGVLRIPFGTNLASELVSEIAPKQKSGGLIVSAGNDRHRDWGLLVEVARMRPSLDFLVACDPTKFGRHGRLPPNLIVKRLTVAEMCAAYRDADVVALPVSENHHGSGLTVALEATSHNKPLVVPRDPNLVDYFADSGAVFYRIGDLNDFAQSIDSVVNQARPIKPGPGEEWVKQRGLTAEDYVYRHVLITRWLLGEEFDASVDQLRSCLPTYD